MIIANPIYDVVFKRLMENERVAKFFIGTMLTEDVISVQLKPQEFTYDKEAVPVAIFRLNFIAIIKTETGEHKKVLIEIQKAKNEMDLMRFRNYLAEQYKKQDVVDDVQVTLPITTIYILGFNLKNIKSACVKVERQYHDLINNTTINHKNEFIENLTHDSFVVQVERITGKYKSRLDKLLSVFEQRNFIDDKGVIKEFNHQADVEELKIMTDILHHVGASAEERKEIEAEREAWRTYFEMFEKQHAELKQKNELIIIKNKALDEKDRAIEEMRKEIEALKKNNQ